ncbi:MAG: efflux transporter periplasmic adaptor subunit [Blastopirellula sp.]|nr:MAG: efflux transporter periplasmic adaptor subunit [Blastopirellula sp.]
MPMFRIRSLSLSVAALLATAILSGCYVDTPIAKEEGSTKPVPVKTVSVMLEQIQKSTTQPATVHAYYRAEIRAKVSGYVKEVKADIGDFVEAGATLAVIDVPEMAKQRQIIEAQITRYESEEKHATAGIELAKANIRSAEAQLAQSKSEMSGVEASLAAIEAEFNRTNDLVQSQSLESRMLDEVRKKRDSELAHKRAMESAINSSAAAVSVAEAKLSSADALLLAAQAETAIAQRQLEELDVLLAYATLKAPFSGVVTARTINPGNLVGDSSKVGNGHSLFVISQIDKVRVHIPVPEAEATLVSRGDTVTLNFPSFPAEEPITATVTRLSSDLDPSTRTMLVEVEFSNEDRKLLPGMFGQASINIDTKVAANMLPARAVRFKDSGQAYLYLVGEDNTVEVVQVTTGIDNGHHIEVLGVESGQQVIDAHLKRFTTGQKVTLVN